LLIPLCYPAGKKMAKDLDAIFKPRSIAVVGASRDPESFGHRVIRCLVESGFEGPLYPVNPRAGEIHTLPCHPSIKNLPRRVDLAVIVVPASKVIPAVEECAARGIKGVVVISAGFRETGRKGERLEQRLVDLIRKKGMRMIGPNCMGVINTDPHVRMNATFAPADMAEGNIAFMSQSGAMGVAILNYASELGLGLSMFASIGNRADVSANDLLEYWKDDPRIRAILLYMESFGNPRRFTQIARTITPNKPVIAVKAGRSASGARAADEHTGEIEQDVPKGVAGTDVAVDALFSQCGVLRVDTLEGLFDTARAVINLPLPAGEAVGVLTNGGGPGIMAADAMEGLDLHVPPLDPRTIAGLKGFLPAKAGIQNPVDMRADAHVDLYRKAIPLMLDDPNIDVMLVIYIGFDYTGFADAVLPALSQATKPVLMCLMGGSKADRGYRRLVEAGFPVYAFPESAGSVIRRLCDYRRYKERQPGRVKRFKSVDNEAVRDRIGAATEEGRLELNPSEMREICRAYGARVLKEGVARSDDQAAAIAEELGYPVVVKVLSERLRKKSDVGGVMLDLRNETEVRKAYKTVLANVKRRFPAAPLKGVLVQEMLKGGQELILGLEHDAIFGPLLKIGAGGPYADIIRDFQFRIVPITVRDAYDMIESMKIYPLLEGTRGRRPVNIPALVDILCRASQLIETFEEIQEFEIDPLIVFPRRKDVWAVDGRMRLFSPGKASFRSG